MIWTLEETRLPAGAEARCACLHQPGAPAPEVHLLSNGRYHVVISSAGGGYSRWRDLAVTRWREDATRDCWGTFLYLRDLSDRRLLVHRAPADRCAHQGLRGHLHPGAGRVPAALAGLEMHTEISVSPEDDVEVRRVT
jgi:cyclic beta-1,2-glucan synthetase